MKNLLFITLMFSVVPLVVSGQENKGCEQFIKAFDYIELNLLQKEFKKNEKIQIDTIIQQSSGIPFIIDEYYAYQMGITKNDFQETDTVIKNKIYRRNQKSLMKIDSVFSISCFNLVNHKRPKLVLRFKRISDETISIWVSKNRRKKNRHSSGKYLIFIYDSENRIEKVFETGWIE